MSVTLKPKSNEEILATEIAKNIQLLFLALKNANIAIPKGIPSLTPDDGKDSGKGDGKDDKGNGSNTPKPNTPSDNVTTPKDIYAMENTLVGGNIIGANMGVGFRKSYKDTKATVDTTGLKEFTNADVLKILEAANTAKGVAKFPAGVYKLDKGIRFNATSYPNVTGIEGDGIGKTVFMADYAQTEDWNANTNLTDARPQSMIVVEKKEGFTAKNFTVWYKGEFYRSPKTHPKDPYPTYFGSIHGVMFDQTKKGLIEGVEVLGCNRCGIILAATGDALNAQNAKWYKGENKEVDLTEHGRENTVKNCFSHHNRVAGVMIQNQVKANIWGCSAHFNGHEADGATGYGIVMASGSVNVDCTVEECLVERNYRKGLDVHDAYSSTFRQNTSRGNRFFGVAIEGRGYPMAKCHIVRNVLIQDPDFRLVVDDGHTTWKDDTNSDYYRWCAIRFEVNPQALKQNYKVPDVVDLQATENFISGINWDGRGAHQAIIVANREDDKGAVIKVNIAKNIIKGNRITNILFAKGYESAVNGLGEFTFEENQCYFEEVTDVPFYFEEKSKVGEITQNIRIRKNTVQITKPSGWCTFVNLSTEVRTGINEITGNSLLMGDFTKAQIRLAGGDAPSKLKVVVKDNIWVKQTAAQLLPAVLLNETNVSRGNVTWVNNRATDDKGTILTIPNTVTTDPKPTENPAPVTPAPTGGWDANYKRPTASGTAPLPTSTLNWDKATDDSVPNAVGDGSLVRAGEYVPKVGWTHLIDKSATPKFAKARFYADGSSSGVYPRWNLGTTNSAGRSTVVFPFRINSVGSSPRVTTGLTMVGAGTSGSPEKEVGGGAVIVKGSTDKTFKFTKANGFHIDGVLYDGTELTLGKTYTMAIAFESGVSFVTFGARWDGNGQVDGDFFEGAEFFSSSLSPSDRVNVSLRVMERVEKGAKPVTPATEQPANNTPANTPANPAPVTPAPANPSSENKPADNTGTPVAPTPNPAPATPPANEGNNTPAPAVEAGKFGSFKLSMANVASGANEFTDDSGKYKVVPADNNQSGRLLANASYTSLVQEVDNHKVFVAAQPAESNQRAMFAKVAFAAGGTAANATLVLPVKVQKLNGTGGTILVTQNDAEVIRGVNINHVDDTHFTFGLSGGIKINGVALTTQNQTTQYEYGKWLVLEVASENKLLSGITFGNNQNGNRSSSVMFGAGTELFVGDDVNKVDAAVTALKTAYNIA